MSLSLKAIRYDIAAVLETIPAFTVVDKYENRNRDLAEMPFVQVWRDPIEQPDTPAEFGSWGYKVTWRLRAWIPLGDDAASQDLSDSLSIAMREAFDTRPGLISQTVFKSYISEVVSDGFPDSEIPFMLIEATLITEAKAP